LPQTSVEVLPTRTIYTFDGKNIHLTLTFMTPALPDDLDILSRPVTYVTWEMKSTDRDSHKVAVYFDASAELTVNQPKQEVEWADDSKLHPNRSGKEILIPSLSTFAVGSVEQPILAKKGDDLRIDWGFLYVSSPEKWIAPGPIVDDPETERRLFVANPLQTNM